MNLIDDAWIPVVRARGKRAWIKPSGVLSEPDDPIVRLDAPRPDFNGALMQFLIGLLQTAYAPEDDDEWEDRFDHPPSEADLDRSFKKIRHAFNLDGDGPRFMQDISLLQDEKIKSVPVSSLIIDAPGEQTLKKNTDFFIKRNQVQKLSTSATAMALLTLQINAPSGGQGHRTGLRGGGPLTTLVSAMAPKAGEKNVLWQTLWLNVLEGTISLSGNIELSDLSSIFPWLDKLKTSQNDEGITPQEAHPYQMYWATPRRIALLFERGDSSCDLLGLQMDTICREYRTRNYGPNYSGVWLHPLSPYYKDNNNQVLPAHPKSSTLNYQHWLGMVGANRDDKRVPAEIVFRFLQQRHRHIRSGFHLWAFGYEMDNMKAVCWREGEFPIIILDNLDAMERFQNFAKHLIDAANEARHFIVQAVKSAWVKRPKDLRGNFAHIDSDFRYRTEPNFYKHLDQAKKVLEKDINTNITDLLEGWFKIIKKEAENIFQEMSQDGQYSAVAPERVAMAWNKLQWNMKGPKIREVLGLALPSKKKTKKGHKNKEVV